MSLESADRWSKIGIGVGCGAGLVLLAADVTAYGLMGAGPLAKPFDGLAVLLVAVVTISAVVAQACAQVLRGQRQIADLLRARHLSDDPPPVRAAPLPLDGLGPESIEAARRISARLDDVA